MSRTPFTRGQRAMGIGLFGSSASPSVEAASAASAASASSSPSDAFAPQASSSRRASPASAATSPNKAAGFGAPLANAASKSILSSASVSSATPRLRPLATPSSALASTSRALDTPMVTPSMAMLAATAAAITPSGRSTFTPRLKASELYGGKIVYGGAASLNERRKWLASSTPYSASMSTSRIRRQQTSLVNRSDLGLSNSTANASTTNHVSPPTAASGMSSTATTILRTLEKLSTPEGKEAALANHSLIDDPLMARAEKRRALAAELLGGDAATNDHKRRRVSAAVTGATALTGRRGGLLNGPPLRSLNTSLPVQNRLTNSSSVGRPFAATKTSIAVTSRLTAATSEAPTPAPAPAPFSFATSSATAATTTTTTSPQQNFKLTFSVPALQSSKPVAAPPPVLTETPKAFSSSVGGKIRARVVEKTRPSAAAAALDEPAPANDVIADVDQSANPFLKLSAMPQFSFSGPQRVSQSEAPTTDDVITATAPANNTFSFSGPLPVIDQKKLEDVGPKPKKTVTFIDQSQALLTSRALNEDRSPLSPSPLPAFPALVQNGKASEESVVSEPIGNGSDTLKFSFSLPSRSGRALASDTDLSGAAQHKFVFSTPSRSSLAATAKSSSSSSAASETKTPAFNSFSSAAPKTNFVFSSASKPPSSVMPDLTAFSSKPASVAPGFKSGSVMNVLMGGPNKLPDVAVSPPSSLRHGSVMDVLGNSSAAPSWGSQLKGQGKPWS